MPGPSLTLTGARGGKHGFLFLQELGDCGKRAGKDFVEAGCSLEILVSKENDGAARSVWAQACSAPRARRHNHPRSGDIACAKRVVVRRSCCTAGRASFVFTCARALQPER